MTALQLYKFITKHKLEYTHTSDQNGVREVILFVDFFALKEFCSLVESWLDLGVTLKNGYICVDMRHICERYDIDLSEVFE